MEAGAHGTVTTSRVFLLTDIEGSTRLWDQAPTDMRLSLARHDAIVAGLIALHGGTLVKSRGEGDSTFSVFTESRDAVLCARDLQGALTTEPWPDNTPIRVRAAVHAGDVEEREGDFFGDVVNRCARLRAAAHGGQVLLSGSVADAVSSHPDVVLKDLGVHRLRDLSRPERIFQLLHPAFPADFPPIETLDRRSHNLPSETTSFVGRERELSELNELLSRFRLVTLTGVGGCGKTRLALHAARASIERVPDGVWLVDLASVTRPESIPAAIASALGLRDDADRSQMDSLIEHLATRAVVVVLDNCEHLVASCAAIVATLLAGTEKIRIIVTSREILGVGGEAVLNVPPLPVPDAGATPEEIRSSPAARLFLDRLASVRRAPADEDDVVADICRRLDGIPLAIEIAAANTRALSLKAVRDRIADRLALIGGAGRTTLPRHKTLRALIDWSFELLTAPERHALTRLSVFVGGWTTASAEEVTAGEELSETRIEDILAMLVDKSMILFEDRDGSDRYRMLETIREYAFEHLMQWGEAPFIRDRHKRWALGLVERANEHVGHAEEPDHLRLLSIEWSNLRTAIDWASETGDAQGELSMAVGLARFWELHGHWIEGIRILERALESDEAGTPRADALIALSRLQQDACDMSRARDAAQRALTIARAQRDQRIEAAALYELGSLTQAENKEDAMRLMHEALELRRTLGDRLGIAASLTNLSYPLKSIGKPDAARAVLDEALEMSRAEGDKQGIAWALTSRSGIRASAGDLEGCRSDNVEALELRYDLGDLRGVADSLTNLSGLWGSVGEHARALETALEARRLYVQVGHREGERWSAGRLGVAQFDSGELDAARRTMTEYIELLGAEPAWGVGLALEILGLIAAEDGAFDHAARLLSRSAEILASADPGRAGSDRVEAALSRARAALGDETVDTLWAAARGTDIRVLVSSAPFK